MNQVIKFDKVDFKALVDSNTYNSSLNFKSKIVDELNNTFTDDQKKWCVGNLYMYLNYHPTNDYPIDLENVWKLIGFSHKKNAKRTLENNFIKDEDYKILLHDELSSETISLPREQNKLETRGRKEEVIMLNADTFKNMCMITKTEKAKEIRMYYVKLENMFNKLLKEEMEENKKLLEEKDKELEEHKEELKKTKKLTTKRWYKKKRGHTIYALKTNKNDPNSLITIGKSTNIAGRESSYMCTNQTADMFYIKRCHNCDVTERVLHHILNKYRVERNKEWFEISEELAIYTINMVCNFMDNFIDYSEELPNTSINDDLEKALLFIKKKHPEMDPDCTRQDPRPEQSRNNNENDNNNEMNNNENDNSETDNNESNDDLSMSGNNVNKKKNKGKEKKMIEETGIIKEKLINGEKLDTAVKLHFDKFVKEYCEVGEGKNCVALDILGAYRIWNKKTDIHTKQNLTTYLQSNYKMTHEYVVEKNTKFSYYNGIEPKKFIVERESDSVLPYYEEFILSECKFDYTYMTTKTVLFTGFTYWVARKYPEYMFSKEEQNKMSLYLNRQFTNCKKIKLNGGTNGYYGVQMKSDNSEKLGVSLVRRKKVYKKEITTNKILETYESLYTAANILNMNEKKLSKMILSKTQIDNCIYTYDLV